MDFNSQLREYLDKNVSYEAVADKIKTLGDDKPAKDLWKCSIKMQVDICSYGVSKEVALARLQSQVLQTRIYKEYFQKNFYNPNL